MRKSRWLFLAMMLTVMAAMGQSWDAGASRFRYCPEFPPDCCHFTFINGCFICTQTGC